MRSVYELLTSVDEDAHIDPFEKAKANGTISRFAKTVNQLTIKEKKGLEDIRIN